ncbi:hypothetical protein [Bacillus wiedmannii]|uniref:hypothetical protein n=1 Tax=Bacillus wiedmannii TaxID=1890302 RepID=UPI0035570BA3
MKRQTNRSTGEIKEQFNDSTNFHGIAEAPSNSFSIYLINTPQTYCVIYIKRLLRTNL